MACTRRKFSIIKAIKIYEINMKLKCIIIIFFVKNRQNKKKRKNWKSKKQNK